MIGGGVLVRRPVVAHGRFGSTIDHPGMLMARTGCSSGAPYIRIFAAACEHHREQPLLEHASERQRRTLDSWQLEDLFHDFPSKRTAFKTLEPRFVKKIEVQMTSVENKPVPFPVPLSQGPL